MYSYLLCVGGSAVAAATAADSYCGDVGQTARRQATRRNAAACLVLRNTSTGGDAVQRVGRRRRVGGNQLIASG